MNRLGSFSERLRAERERLKMTQTEFGKIGGVTKKTQALYEHGERTPDAGYLVAIAEHGADYVYILSGHRDGYLTVQLQAERYWREQGMDNLPPLGSPNIEEFFPREIDLLINYRKATEEGKQAIETTAKAVEKTKK